MIYQYNDDDDIGQKVMDILDPHIKERKESFIALKPLIELGFKPSKKYGVVVKEYPFGDVEIAVDHRQDGILEWNVYFLHGDEPEFRTVAIVRCSSIFEVNKLLTQMQHKYGIRGFKMFNDTFYKTAG